MTAGGFHRRTNIMNLNDLPAIYRAIDRAMEHIDNQATITKVVVTSEARMACTIYAAEVTVTGGASTEEYYGNEED